jgi:hypothetical protein
VAAQPTENPPNPRLTPTSLIATNSTTCITGLFNKGVISTADHSLATTTTTVVMVRACATTSQPSHGQLMVGTFG